MLLADCIGMRYTTRRDKELQTRRVAAVLRNWFEGRHSAEARQKAPIAIVQARCRY